MIAVYVLAVLGLFVLARSFVVLALVLLAYQTLIAMLFAGATRYRVPWDFLVAIMAAAGISAMVGWWQRRRGYTGASERCVELLDTLDAAFRRELLERACTPGAAHRSRARQVACQCDDRLRECFGVRRRDHQPRLAVGDDLGEPAHRARDDRSRTLHRLECHHAEPLAERGHDHDRCVLDRTLNRRHEPEEANGVVEPELARVRLECRLEWAATRDVERDVGNLGTRLRERTKQDEVTLDRDQATDAEEARLPPFVRHGLTVAAIP